MEDCTGGSRHSRRLTLQLKDKFDYLTRVPHETAEQYDITLEDNTEVEAGNPVVIWPWGRAEKRGLPEAAVVSRRGQGRRHAAAAEGWAFQEADYILQVTFVTIHAAASQRSRLLCC